MFRVVFLGRRGIASLVIGLFLLSLTLGGGAGAISGNTSARFSAHLTTTTFLSSEIGSVKLVYRFSRPSKSFAYRLTFRKGTKWQPIRRVETGKKTRALRGSKSIALETLFGARPIRAGNYRLTLSADYGSKLLAFRVIGLGMVASPLSTGDYHTCAVIADGRVKCWGANYSGQLGDGTKTTRTSAVEVRDISTAVQVSTGAGYTCALLVNRAVRCWGTDDSDQLSNGTTTSSSTPSDVVISDAVQVSAGARHACALLADGKVECWGNNSAGQLGNDTPGDSTAVEVSGISRAVQVSAGYNHSCALLPDRTIKCWGDNLDGQLGNGTLTGSSTPVLVKGISTAIQVSAGDFHTCALLANGAAECWGGNGICIDWCTNPAEKIWSETPVPLSGFLKAVEISDRTATCALVSGGAIKCWDWEWNGSRVPDPVSQISGISSATDVSIGRLHICARISDGSVRCWGDNYYGQLGNGTTGGYSSAPVDVIGIP